MHVELCRSLQGTFVMAGWMERVKAERVSEEGLCWVRS